MDEDLKTKIQKLREFYGDDDSQQILNNVEKELRNKIVQEGLKDSDAVKMIIADAQEKINSINSIIQFDETIGDIERKLLFRERRVHQFYLNRFNATDVDQRLNALKTFLDQKIAEIDKDTG